MFEQTKQKDFKILRTFFEKFFPSFFAILAIIMASLLQNSSASIYNASCLVKANYLPTASLGSYTCDFYLNAISGSGQMLASVNWATVTPAFIEAMADVNGQTMISQFEYWALSCCVRIK